MSMSIIMIFNTILLCFSIVLTSGQFFNYLPLHFRLNGRNYFHGNDQEQEPEPKLQIVNGEAATQPEATFAVYIQQTYTNRSVVSTTSCTGTLIDSQTVLTAAHCVYESTFRGWNGRVTFRYGTHEKENPRYPDIAGTKIIVHPGYRSDGILGLFDLALIRLEHPVTLNPRHVGIARLPQPNRYRYQPGSEVVIYGWGDTTRESRGVYPNKLQKTSLFIAPDEPVVAQMKQYSDGSVFMARNRKSSACHGDSGGPIVVERDVLVGVLSGSNPQVTDVYECPPNLLIRITKVESYLGWIEFNRYLLTAH